MRNASLNEGARGRRRDEEDRGGQSQAPWRGGHHLRCLRSSEKNNCCIYYLYDHSASDKEIDGRGPGRGEKANEEAFEDDGSMPRQPRLEDYIRRFG